MKRLWVSVVLAGVAVLGLSIPASAHNVLVGSDPAKGAVLAVGPSHVRLDFDAPVQQGPDIITVIGPNGDHWERTTRATVEGDSVSTSVAPLGPAGLYTIGYRIISADGHPVSGSLTFTLTTPGTGTPVSSAAGATTASPAAGNGAGGTLVWPWLVGAAVLLAAGLVVALRMGGARGTTRR